MPTIKLSMFSTDETVDRPILASVVEDVKRYLGYTNDIYTVYDEKDSIYREKNVNGELKSPNTLTNESIVVDATEDILDDYSRYLGYINPDTKPFYKDTDIDSESRILYYKKKLNISFKYSSKSKSGVNALINRLRVNSVTEDYYITHNLEYSIMLPSKFMHLLQHINTLKENEDNTGAQLADYIANTFDSRARVVGTLDGNAFKDDIALRERQVSVIGYIADDVSDVKKEYDDNTGMWSVSFTYSVEYEKPTMFIVKYPLVVYNQLIGKDFRTTMDSVENRLTVRTPTTEAIYAAVTSIPRLNKVYNGQYVVFPSNDTEQLPAPTPNYVRTATAITIVDKNDPTAIFNINDIRGYKFKDTFLDFLKREERDYIGKPFQSMVHIELMKNGKPDYDNTVTMDENLNLRSTLPLDPKSTYRVSINMLTDMSILSKEATSRTVKYIEEENKISNQLNTVPGTIRDIQSKLIDSLQTYPELTPNEVTLLIKNIELLTLNYTIGDYENKIKAFDNANIIVNNSALPKESRMEVKDSVQLLLNTTQHAKYSDRTIAVDFKRSNTLFKDTSLGLNTTQQADIVDKLVLIVNYKQYADEEVPDRNSTISKLQDTGISLVNTAYNDIDNLTIDVVNNEEYNSKLVTILDPIKNSNLSDDDIKLISKSAKHEYSKKLIDVIHKDIKTTVKNTVGNNASVFTPALESLKTLVNSDSTSSTERDTLQDVYLGLFNIGVDAVSKVIKKPDDINRVIFNIELPSSIKFFTKELLINIPALIE